MKLTVICCITPLVCGFLTACSYTPEQQAYYRDLRAYWERQNGYGADSR